MNRLSFVAKPKSDRGQWQYFAVPAEKHIAGSVTGIKVFCEMLDALAGPDGHAVPTTFIFEALAKAMNEREKKSRSGAALQFVFLLGEVVTFFAKNAAYQSWLDERQAQFQAYAEAFDAKEVKTAADFVARMSAARATKAAKGGRA